MIELNLIGGGFQNDPSSSAFNKNRYVKWVRDDSSDISIHVNQAIFHPINKAKKNFAFLSESSTIVKELWNQVKNNIQYIENNFELLFAHDTRIVGLSNKFKYTHSQALPWIQNRKIYEKSKRLSFVASNKRYCEEHNFRHQILTKYRDQVDHYGRGFGTKEIPHIIQFNGVEESGKIIALKDYMFSFSIENGDYDISFTEKITDCFATGTIPIQWGSKKIVEIFDAEGIIFLEDFNIDMLNRDFYESKRVAVKNNLDACCELLSAEDYFYVNYIK